MMLRLDEQQDLRRILPANVSVRFIDNVTEYYVNIKWQCSLTGL